MISLTTNRLHRLLDYDPATGIFRWKKRPGRNRSQEGSIAGGLGAGGYWRIGIDGRRYLAQRLVWLYVYGTWPLEDIDHKDRDRLNNKIANLRPATRSQNNANAIIRKHNQTGFKGVKQNNGSWLARISKDRKEIYLGNFPTAEAAHAAYTDAARRIYREFAHDGVSNA